MKTKKSLINWLGLLGVIALLSYTAAVLFAPLAYPGYNWIAQAVSDLSAESAPSRILWNQLAACYNVCEIVSATLVMVAAAQNRPWNRTLRLGIYLFAAMNWVSAIGYSAFPLSNAGSTSGFQSTMHLAVTAAVVLLSILSLILIMLGGWKRKVCPSLAVWAAIALALMLLGTVGVNLVPPEYFGIPERFSVFAAAGFGAVLGIYLFREFPEAEARKE